MLPPLTPEEQSHSLRLAAHIRDALAAAGGWLSFERFMELALYAPGLGYYSAGSVKLGAGAAGGERCNEWRQVLVQIARGARGHQGNPGSQSRVPVPRFISNTAVANSTIAAAAISANAKPR